MSGKSRLLIVLLLVGPLQSALAAELATLFTTPQERRLIDRNRYKQAVVQPEKPAEVEGEVIEIDDIEFTLELVTREYRISGITLSTEGTPMVWINSKSYEDGARLDDDSRIQVVDGDQLRVRITARDGKQYLAASGETVEISVLEPVESE
jgi:hypothetical protein